MIHSPDLQPTLRGHLLSLRPLRTQDFDGLYQCASDPLIWEQHPQRDRYKREVFQKFFDAAMESKGALVAFDQSSEKVIGSSRYYNFNSEKREIVVGYTFLARDFWGGRYNGEMKALMLNHIFQFVDGVLFEIGEQNLRSRTAIQRIGAQLVGRQTLDGRSHVIYRMNRAGFLL